LFQTVLRSTIDYRRSRATTAPGTGSGVERPIVVTVFAKDLGGDYPREEGPIGRIGQMVVDHCGTDGQLEWLSLRNAVRRCTRAVGHAASAGPDAAGTAPVHNGGHGRHLMGADRG
jgi:hypothetical protein